MTYIHIAELAPFKELLVSMGITLPPEPESMCRSLY